MGSGQIEVYARGRYFTVTGDVFEDRNEIAHAPFLTKWYDGIFGDPKVAQPPASGPVTTLSSGYEGSDDSLIAAIRRSSNGPRFDRLWSGDTSEYGDDWSSADQTLCNILAWWCGPNAKRIDRLWRASKLSDRDKFERVDYRRRTIDSAIDSCTSFYQPKDRIPVRQDSEAFKRAKEDRPYAMTDIGNASGSVPTSRAGQSIADQSVRGLSMMGSDGSATYHTWQSIWR